MPATPTKTSTLLAEILIERYGLDGAPPRSVAEVAEKHGLTRLAVRALEGPLVAQIRRVIERRREEEK